MSSDDFFSNEKSTTITDAQAGDARIEFVAGDGVVTVLKEGIPLQPAEVVDSTYMSAKALRSFLGTQIQEARELGVLFSLHVKATMMKVADPIMFGHTVSVFFADFFAKHGEALNELGVDADNGLSELETKVATLPEAKRAELEFDLKAAMDTGPDLYMVNSDKGITNLHVSSDVIIDASMPALIALAARLGVRTAKSATPNASFPTIATRRSMRRPSTSARNMAPSTRLKWALSRMSV